MATLREVSGRTLRFPGRPGELAPRTVRLSLVERPGLWGPQFNVRETRAEPGPGQALRLLGAGRVLSWRWVRRPDAEALLRQRVEVLAGLGYEDLAPVGTRGKWDWLRELAARVTDGDPEHGAVLRDAVLGLGLGRAQLLAGLATIVELDADSLHDPTPETAARAAAHPITAVISLLAEHPELRDVAARWLALAAFPYEVDRDTLVGWLEADGPIADALAPRMASEGLALVGATGVRRLEIRGGTEAIRRAASGWTRHLAES